MIPGDSSSRTNKNNGSINRSKKKDKKLNSKNMKKIFTHSKHSNSTE